MKKLPGLKLANEITIERVRNLAGKTYYDRGKLYYETGHVLEINTWGESINAEVEGNYDDYTVVLSVHKRKFEYSCTCPLGVNGEFCKHLVAVCLKFINAREGCIKFTETHTGISNDEIRNKLEELKKSELADLFFEFALDNRELREQLRLFAASQSTDKGCATFVNALDNAFYIDGFIKYNEVDDYCHGIELVIDALEKALNQGQIDTVLKATKHAFTYVEDALNGADSEYELHEIFQRLLKLHLDAYKQSDFDPKQMAKQLFLWEINDAYCVFSEISENFINDLDSVCKDEFFNLVKSEWQKLPVLKPGSKQEYGGPRYRINSIMEKLARETDNLQDIIDVKSKDLSCEFSYLKIAEECRKAGEYQLAMKWAETGLKEFKNKCDERLLDFLANEYQRIKRHDDAMTLAWRIFEQTPHLSGYQKLVEHAKKSKCLEIWRCKALDRIRTDIELEKKKHRNSRWFKPDHSTMVEIFLWEKKYEEAWMEAKTGGCSNRLWMRLAGHREKNHPADAVGVYTARLPDIINQTNNDAYKEAVLLFKRICDCMKRMDKEKEFRTYCLALRGEHKRKRNFIKEMDHAGFL